MKTAESLLDKHQIAAQAIRAADGLRIVAGAGMSADSGLPIFIGLDSFWRTLGIPINKNTMNFQRMVSSPGAFIWRPDRAWGFYGQLLNLYRDTVPHDGFRLLQEMASKLPHGAFVCTGNVDGQFQKAGFSDDSLLEVSGSIHYLQCVSNCGLIWTADDFKPEINLEKRLITSALPRCPMCGELARPNIRKCCGEKHNSNRLDTQNNRHIEWQQHLKNPVTIAIEMDCAAVAMHAMEEHTDKRGFLIRIQSWDDLWEDESFDANREVVLNGGILEVLRGITAALRS
jgi:NAD-dependent SIR2 family protein deacetylase